MKSCCNACVVNNVDCPIKDCKYWINYKDDLNCSLIAIEKNGPMTLREIADRLGLSFVRIKQIQDKAIRRFMTSVDKEVF
jgi:hypothetical protein